VVKAVTEVMEEMEVIVLKTTSKHTLAAVEEAAVPEVVVLEEAEGRLPFQEGPWKNINRK
jgi:hypothetical protein